MVLGKDRAYYLLCLTNECTRVSFLLVSVIKLGQSDQADAFRNWLLNIPVRAGNKALIYFDNENKPCLPSG